VQDSRWIGRILRDKWRIERKIARGGMGTVYAATHKNNGSRAAIKVLHPEYARDQDTRSRFLQEGYAANQVSHSGVVRILDDDTSEEGLPYLVMELLEGELLEQRRIHSGGRLPLDEVIDVAEQLLDVMAAAHTKGTVHRDIKPDNIFVTKEGYIKVLDFGFARMRDGLRKEQTATGFLLGTPGFMAPEQAAGMREIDARTDVWAIGATLFVLLTGQPVHAGETAAEMLVQAANYAVRPIGELEPNVPVKLRQLVDRALAFERKDRFPDAKTMLMALRAMQSKAHPVPSVRPAAGAPPPSDDDGRTLMRRSPVSQMGSNPHEDRTVTGRVEELEPEVLESLYTPTIGKAPNGSIQIHPADQEGRTLALDPDGPTMAAPHTSKLPKYPGAPREQEHEHESNDHTVMMESRPRLGAPAPVNTPRGHQGMPSPLGPHPHAHPQSQPSYPDMGGYAISAVPQPSPSQPMIMAPAPSGAIPLPGRPPQKAEGGSPFSTALIFIAVAGITMVVVILTGLIIIVGTE
jgi:serine/threonine-protein kinase